MCQRPSSPDSQNQWSRNPFLEDLAWFQEYPVFRFTMGSGGAETERRDLSGAAFETAEPAPPASSSTVIDDVSD